MSDYNMIYPTNSSNSESHC